VNHVQLNAASRPKEKLNKPLHNSPSIPNKRQGISLATFVVCGGLGNI